MRYFDSEHHSFYKKEKIMIGGFDLMAQKLKLKDIGMDTIEILYYERQSKRKKAYAAKRRKKLTTKKEITSKKTRKEQGSDKFSIVLKKAI